VPVYSAVPSYEHLKKVLDDKLREYNESNAVMNLVLFQQVGYPELLEVGSICVLLIPLAEILL
jgi:hypothetical protein